MCPQVSQKGAVAGELAEELILRARGAALGLSGGPDFCAALALSAGLAPATCGSAVCALRGVAAASSGFTCARSSRLRYSTPSVRKM